MNRAWSYLRSHWRNVVIHLFVWLFYLAFNNILLLTNSNNKANIVQLFVTYPLVAILFYVNVYGIIAPSVERRKYVQIILKTILLTGAYILVRYIVFFYIFPFLDFSNEYSKTRVMFQRFLPDSIWIASQYLLFSYGYWFAIYSVQLERKKRRIEADISILERDKARTELAFLQAKLNPHFLYNTLNFLFSDALEASPRLADSIMCLSQMMRSVSEVSKQPMVSVSNELTYIRNYLKLQQYRFGSQLNVQLTITGTEYEHHISLPPLTLISLVENIFKYGEVFNHSVPAQINVHLSETGLRFQTVNKRTEEPNYRQGGLGLTNINSQLSILYKDNYTLDIKEEEGIFSVDLQLSNYKSAYPLPLNKQSQEA
ncbi:sensor histidine kinase [Spirosoma fluviale]|uniref:Histidine kinase n=1 Tax=Spirosoma fluviale TaxID=1597977 RepID=A0A286GUE1_9BACT|nr:sensor histidine kinase [Spirosoma fluviale]SOD99141.1 Histidine kinase [Spirosoma fluviale]